MKKWILALLLLLLALPLCAHAEAADIQAGDILLFGHYEQDADPDNGPEPIQWLVLEADEDSLLLISQYELSCRKYCEQQYQLVSWADSDLRAWLNGSFLTYAFTDAERALIPETPLHTPGGTHPVQRNGETEEITIPESDTLDQIFVLSSEEARRYFAYGTNDQNVIAERRVSLPSYAVLLKLAVDVGVYWEETRDLPDAAEYAGITGGLHPLAQQTDGIWAIVLPSITEYSKFWQEMPEYYLMQPWLLREQGMRCNSYSDGGGDMEWYQWYGWDTNCVRPALRINRDALAQGLAIRPVTVSPGDSDPALTGVWKAEMDGVTAYYRFDMDCFMRAGAYVNGGVQLTETRCQVDLFRGRLLACAAISRGEIIEMRYGVQGDRLKLSFNGQEMVFERVDESEFPVLPAETE